MVFQGWIVSHYHPLQGVNVSQRLSDFANRCGAICQGRGGYIYGNLIGCSQCSVYSAVNFLECLH